MAAGATGRSGKRNTTWYRTGLFHRQEPWEAKQGRVNTGARIWAQGDSQTKAGSSRGS